jgi:hypothetical protein
MLLMIAGLRRFDGRKPAALDAATLDAATLNAD